MNRATRITLGLGAVALAARVVLACATSDDGASPDVTPDSGTTTVPPPVTQVDAGADATNDADAEPPNPCNEDGFCYSDLPAADSFDASALFPTLSGVTFPIRGAWTAPNGRLWAVTAAGHVMVWDGSWHVAAIVQGSLRTIWGSSATDLWVGGESGVIMRGTVTEVPGASPTVTFTRVPITPNVFQTIARIDGRSGTDVWAIADGQSGSSNLNRVFKFNATAATPGFSIVTVPSSWTDSTARIRVQALWLSPDDLWIGGYETSCGGPGPCNFKNQLVAARGASNGDGGTAWQHVPLVPAWDTPIAFGALGSDGVHVMAVRGPGDDAYVAKLSADPSKLDGGTTPDSGANADGGTYAWTNEFAHSFGTPNTIWVNDRNDIWVAGGSGAVRHLEGGSWKIAHVARTATEPLLHDLYAFATTTAANGDKELWVLGDDTAIHWKVKP